MGKNLLILSYYFPPENIIGAVRPHHIAQHFSKSGWNVCVVTADDINIPANNFVDLDCIQVKRVKMPWFLQWMTPFDPDTSGLFSRLRGIVSRGVRFILRSIIFPEQFVFIKGAYLNEIQRLADQTKFDLVISTALPFVMHDIARVVAERYSIPWVADNRDLWATSPYRKLVVPRRFLDVLFEKKVLAQADLIIGVTQGIVDYYKDEYGLTNALLVMNGYANSDLVRNSSASISRKDDNRLSVVYGGILYGGVRDPTPLFKAIESEPLLFKNVLVKFFGSEPDKVATFSADYPSCSIECHPRLTKAEITREFQSASVLLVLLGDNEFENIVLPGKFFEYIGFGKPIVAVAAENSELAKLINKYNLGIATTNPLKIVDYLSKLINGGQNLDSDPPIELASTFQLTRLEKAVNELIVRKGGH